MSIVKNPPNTILLHGNADSLVADLAAKEALTPGELVEMVNVAGVNQWQKSTLAANTSPAVVVNSPYANLGVDDVYPIGSVVPVAFLQKGDTFWGLVPSGQSVANGGYLRAAAGRLTAGASTDKFQSLDNLCAVTATTRCRVQVV